MRSRKVTEEISVMEAVDYLTHMAEIDLSYAGGKKQKTIEVCDWEMQEMPQEDLSWGGDLEHLGRSREKMRETFKAILIYLKYVYEKQKGHLRDLHAQKGIQAIMLLASEAASKMDQYTEAFTEQKKHQSLFELKEYQEMQQYYQIHILQPFQKYAEIKQGWQNEWEASGNEEGYDPTHRGGLETLFTVRQDREYELFLIRKEDGRPFFSQELTRHLHLVGEFDAFFIQAATENFFDRMKILQDKDAHKAAAEILEELSPHIDDFYKEALRHKGVEIVESVFKAIMALMLAANPRNLMQNTTGKNCLEYFTDFHSYLRYALSTEDYKKGVLENSKALGRFFHTVFHLSQMLSRSFFLRPGNDKEMGEWIHSFILQSIEGESKKRELHMWDEILEIDRSIRQGLKRYPNGPLIKTIELF
ncbi:MAG: hypothetical protein HYZ48_05250, partial [Chlamydiales bacterium]|nr:hypothetical protein [Chlamydiales bacterium]